MSADHTHSKEESGSIWSILNLILGVGIGGFTLVAVLGFVFGGVGSLLPKVAAPKAPPAAPPAAAPAAAAPSAPAAASAAAATGGATSAAGVFEITLKPSPTDPTGMKYDITSFKVKAGQKIKLTFENKHTLPQPHNVCIGKLGSKATILQLAMAAATMPDAMAKGFIPESPDIIAHTKLLQMGQSETIEFSLPAAGEYPYICTFPGHGILMNGSITVE
jgi:azurin